MKIRLKTQGKNSERIGFAMIVASLVVILFITVFLFQHQRASAIEQIRVQGVSLVRLLSGIPYDQLVLSDGRQGVLELIKQTQSQSHFAYAVVVDPHGQPLMETIVPGVLVPPDDLSTEPSAWLGERLLNVQGSEQAIREYYGPVLNDGNFVAHLRIGYLEPGFGFSASELPLFATVALPVFLLTPLFYFLVKKEIRPLAHANNKIQEALSSGVLGSVEMRPSDELNDFISRFQSFMDTVSDRMRVLESEKNEVDLSNHVLSYQKARTESALQTLPDAIMVMDESGSITYSNAKMHSLMGVSAEAVNGSRPNDWCDNSEILSYIASCSTNSSGAYRSKAVEFVPNHAPEKRISLSAYPLFSPRDTRIVLGTMFVFRDVTTEAMAKLARGEFVSHVAHELKSPLNVLNMYSETLQEDAGKTPDLTVEAANVIHDEVERLSGLINNLLSMTKIETGAVSLDRKRVKLHDLLRDVFATMSRTAKDMDIRLSLEIPPELMAVSIDKDLFRIALNNLLSNAIKYNRPGGTVTVRAEEDDHEIVVSVIDTGIGVSDEDMPRIFDKFFRSDDDEVRKRTGHGLGLALAQEIVRLHQSEIKVRSRNGYGTEFSIHLKKDMGLFKQAI